MPKANKKNLYLDRPSKSRGYMSGDDRTWDGEDAPDHIWKWYQDMMLAEQYSLKRLLTEDAAHDTGSTVGDVLDLIQDIQSESEKSTGWGRFKGVGIEFIKIAMAEIPLVGGTLGALDGLYAMYEAGKKEEHTWKDIEEYPILRRIKMHPQLMKVLDDMVLRRIDEAYKEYLATLGRDTLVSQITDIDVFTHKWVMEETEETIDVAVISELRQYIRQILLERSSFNVKGSSNYFRVELLGIGYAEGGEQLRFQECQADVDALMQTPEFIAAKEKYETNNTTKDIVKDDNGKWIEIEKPATFRPRFYDVNNAWISNPENRGKGHGKEIYKAFIEQAVEYSKSYGGVFIGAHRCVMGSGTSEDAQRVWKSLGRDYTSSGLVIFIGL